MERDAGRAKRRRSKKRDAVYRVLAESKSHPTAEQIYRALKPDWPALSLGTVYRNLGRFIEEGRAAVVGVVDGQERFDGNARPHNHLFCSCGAVIDINDVELDKGLDEKASLLSGCEVSSHEIVFHGLCPDCKIKNQKNGGC